MAKSILDIVIKLSKQGGADKETLKGLVQLKSGIMEAAAVAGTLVAAGYTVKKIWDATGATAIEYANKVRAVTDVSRLSAEESSKLVQITDDFKISQEELLKVMQKNGDEYDYSIAGLASMSDAYLSLGSSEEKTLFMQERFGKSWGTFVELMEQGSERIIAAGDGISESLILDDAALESARQYERELDALGDSFHALQVSIGNDFIPIVTDTIGGFNDLKNITDQANASMESGEITYRRAALAQAAINEVLDRQKQVVMDADAARWDGLASYYETQTALDGIATSTEDVAAAAAEASEANQNFLSMLGSAQGVYEGYIEKNKQLAEERAQLEQEKSGLIAQGYSEQSSRIVEINGKLEENKKKSAEVATQFELDNKKIMLGYLERKLTADGTLTDSELTWLLEKGEAWGIYSEEAIEAMRAAMDEADEYIAKLEGIPSTIQTDVELNVPQTIPTPGQPVRFGAMGGGQVNSGDSGVAPAVTTQSVSGKRVIIYGNVTVNAQGSVVDALEELGV